MWEDYEYEDREEIDEAGWEDIYDGYREEEAVYGDCWR